jgi:hypothetical protein
MNLKILLAWEMGGVSAMPRDCWVSPRLLGAMFLRLSDNVLERRPMPVSRGQTVKWQC